MVACSCDASARMLSMQPFEQVSIDRAAEAIRTHIKIAYWMLETIRSSKLKRRSHTSPMLARESGHPAPPFVLTDASRCLFVYTLNRFNKRIEICLFTISVYKCISKFFLSFSLSNIVGLTISGLIQRRSAVEHRQRRWASRSWKFELAARRPETE